MPNIKHIVGEEFTRENISSYIVERDKINTSLVTLKHDFIPGSIAVYHWNKRLTKRDFVEVPPNQIRFNNGPSANQPVIMDYQTIEDGE